MTTAAARPADPLAKPKCAGVAIPAVAAAMLFARPRTRAAPSWPPTEGAKAGGASPWPPAPGIARPPAARPG